MFQRQGRAWLFMKQKSNHKDIATLLKAENKRVCWCCNSANCFIKQTICQTLKMQKKYLRDCKGKQISFKELKEIQSEAKTATAQIKVPATVDSDTEGN